MTPVTTFGGKTIALFGLGGSGLVTAHALMAGGASVEAWDDGPAAREKAAGAGVPLVDLRGTDWSRYCALLLTPGVPITHPAPHWAAAMAAAAGVEIIGDIELFCRERAARAAGAPFVAITGTNGKSTTTALTAHLLAQAGRDVAMGGNIGRAILDLPPPAMGRVHVIECSSFQIDLAPSLNPSVGVLTNITPDHIDRHGTLERYAEVKSRLAAKADVAFVSVDDEFSARIASGEAAPMSSGRIQLRDARPSAHGGVWPVSVREALPRGVFVAGGRIRMRLAPGREELALGALAGAPNLRGAHNAQNAAFAAAIAHQFGLSEAEIQRGLDSFAGLPHRMEIVGKRGRVLFVNDSKATNADSAEKALLSFSDIFWILGGKAKEGGLNSLRPLFPRVTKAFLIGAATEQFAAQLEGAVAYERCGALDVAFARAAEAAAASAAPEPVVLLSPACASQDQFPNFEVRGDRFRDLARTIIAS